jgi:biopolymer transport protein ExbD
MHGPSLDDGGDEHIAAINIIPLVDVVLVLLIIFMVTTAFSRDSAMKVDLPQGSRADQKKQPPVEITVTVDKAENVYVNGQPAKINQLNDKIESLRNRSRKTILVLRGDTNVRYGKIVPVLDEISRNKDITLTLALQAPAQGTKSQ